jgi:TolA-binding protein
MKKNLIRLSVVAALTTSSFASDINKEMLNQIQALKAQIEALEKKVAEQEVKQQTQTSAVTTVDEKRIEKIEKKLDTVSKTATAAKIQSGNDNLKWDVDFRTQVDNIQYKHVDGSKSKNNALLTNRLWLGMAYKADDNSSFHGKLSYNKAFGDTANHSQSNTNPGYANFDWVTNENATDNTIKLKEAYWLYTQEKLFGSDVPWAVSVGRRPSTDGLPINIRNDQQPNSPLSHVVDVEFDGFSIKFDTQSLTGLTGSWFKICGGRGLTNAVPRFDMFSPAYSQDDDKNVDVDMLGFIAVPYDDGQYSVHMNYAKAWNLIGFDGQSLQSFNTAYGAYQSSPSSTTAYNLQMATPSFKDVGDIDFATILFKTEGIGDGISDYLDNTIAFASFAASKTNPNSLGMLGSTDSETGTSVWLGINAPCPITPDVAKIGFEWNKGSKYWRSMTYGEDTYAGSKIATRGQAWEVYRNQQLTKSLTWGVSYVFMDYDYTGSNSFFGADGTPVAISDADGSAVAEAQDVRTYITQLSHIENHKFPIFKSFIKSHK